MVGPGVIRKFYHQVIFSGPQGYRNQPGTEGDMVSQVHQGTVIDPQPELLIPAQQKRHISGGWSVEKAPGYSHARVGCSRAADPGTEHVVEVDKAAEGLSSDPPGYIAA